MTPSLSIVTAPAPAALAARIARATSACVTLAGRRGIVLLHCLADSAVRAGALLLQALRACRNVGHPGEPQAWKTEKAAGERVTSTPSGIRLDWRGNRTGN